VCTTFGGATATPMVILRSWPLQLEAAWAGAAPAVKTCGLAAAVGWPAAAGAAVAAGAAGALVAFAGAGALVALAAGAVAVVGFGAAGALVGGALETVVAAGAGGAVDVQATASVKRTAGTNASRTRYPEIINNSLQVALSRCWSRSKARSIARMPAAAPSRRYPGCRGRRSARTSCQLCTCWRCG